MLRIIGDVHQEYNRYAKIVRNCDWSVQLGDFGFYYTNPILNSIDPYHHRFFGGNHDNYDIYQLTPRSLGDFGVEQIGGVKFFYIRGGFSIDWVWRVQEEQRFGLKTWWKEEQLSWDKMNECLDLYQRAEPDIVITHTAPKSIADKIGDPNFLARMGFDAATFTTNTQELLESCLQVHQPKSWFFGHFHQTWAEEYMGTKFRCIKECGYVDVDEGGNIV